MLLISGFNLAKPTAEPTQIGNTKSQQLPWLFHSTSNNASNY